MLFAESSYALRGPTLVIWGLFCNSASGFGVEKDIKGVFEMLCFQISQAGNWI